MFFFLFSFAFVGGGVWRVVGGDVNVHADASCDVAAVAKKHLLLRVAYASATTAAVANLPALHAPRASFFLMKPRHNREPRDHHDHDSEDNHDILGQLTLVKLLMQHVVAKCMLHHAALVATRQQQQY